MANAYQVAQSVVGRTIDFDGIYPGECVDLVLYVSNVFGCPLRGNGNQIGTLNPNIGQFADVIPYSPSVKLQVGDILSFSEGGSAYGHTLVYGGGSVSNALVCEQNYNYNKVVVEHRREIASHGILRVVRFRNQDNYKPSGASSTSPQNGNQSNGQKVKVVYKVYEITCDTTDGLDGINGKVIDKFFKCNKVTGEINGDWLIYNRYTGGKGYIKKDCVKEKTNYSKSTKSLADGKEVNPYKKFKSATSDGIDQKDTQAIYSLDQFLQLGRVKWSGFEWGYKSKEDFPSNIKVSGSKTNAHGYLADGDDYIVLQAPNSWGDVTGRIYDTPFGYQGKVYALNGEGVGFTVYVK